MLDMVVIGAILNGTVSGVPRMIRAA